MLLIMQKLKRIKPLSYNELFFHNMECVKEQREGRKRFSLDIIQGGSLKTSLELVPAWRVVFFLQIFRF